MAEQEYNIERVGIKNLDFTGTLIGSSSGPVPQLKIFRTKAGKFIGVLRADAERSNANSFDKPEDLITWLKGVIGSPISQAAQEAVEEAAKNDDIFKTAWNEHVD
jgi:hypothetical protein